MTKSGEVETQANLQQFDAFTDEFVVRQRFARLHDAHERRFDLMFAIFFDFGARLFQLGRCFFLCRHTAYTHTYI